MSSVIADEHGAVIHVPAGEMITQEDDGTVVVVTPKRSVVVEQNGVIVPGSEPEGGWEFYRNRIEKELSDVMAERDEVHGKARKLYDENRAMEVQLRELRQSSAGEAASAPVAAPKRKTDHDRARERWDDGKGAWVAPPVSPHPVWGAGDSTTPPPVEPPPEWEQLARRMDRFENSVNTRVETWAGRVADEAENLGDALRLIRRLEEWQENDRQKAGRRLDTLETTTRNAIKAGGEFRKEVWKRLEDLQRQLQAARGDWKGSAEGLSRRLRDMEAWKDRHHNDPKPLEDYTAMQERVDALDRSTAAIRDVMGDQAKALSDLQRQLQAAIGKVPPAEPINTQMVNLYGRLDDLQRQVEGGRSIEVQALENDLRERITLLDTVVTAELRAIRAIVGPDRPKTDKELGA